jgi:hypothetical protein
MPGLDAALGLAADRAVDPARYAIGGLSPRLAVRPKDRSEVVEALRAAGRDRLSVLPGEPAWLWHRSPRPNLRRSDRPTALDAIVEYDPRT